MYFEYRKYNCSYFCLVGNEDTEVEDFIEEELMHDMDNSNSMLSLYDLSNALESGLQLFNLEIGSILVQLAVIQLRNKNCPCYRHNMISPIEIFKPGSFVV